MNRLDFAALIASRLCHDLASPVSAMANGAELIADEPDPAERAELSRLICASTAVLVARLRCYRLLFAGGQDLPVPLTEAKTTLGDFLSGNGHVTLDWASATVPSTRTMARLLMALAITAAEAIEGDGTIRIGSEADGWRVTANGPLVRLSSEHRVAIEAHSHADPRPRVAIAILAAALAESIEVAITLAETTTSLTFVIEHQ